MPFVPCVFPRRPLLCIRANSSGSALCCCASAYLFQNAYAQTRSIRPQFVYLYTYHRFPLEIRHVYLVIFFAKNREKSQNFQMDRYSRRREEPAVSDRAARWLLFEFRIHYTYLSIYVYSTNDVALVSRKVFSTDIVQSAGCIFTYFIYFFSPLRFTVDLY